MEKIYKQNSSMVFPMTALFINAVTGKPKDDFLYTVKINFANRRKRVVAKAFADNPDEGENT